MSSLYIHIPFCERKCFYCDFYSIEDHGALSGFLDSLHSEIELNSNYGKVEHVETIYIGGGTPSHLSPKQIAEILGHVGKYFSIISNPEITMEVNPGTIDYEKMRGYKLAGINRLSIGVQSFNDEELKFLTRIHSSEDADQAIRIARECGFDNISIDLIYALPDQTLSQWEDALRKTILHKPEHVSAYSLIVEDNTPLASKVSTNEIVPLSIDKDAEMYELTMEIMEQAGYNHYEVSNYAKPGFQSRHNSNYWNHSNYIGLGPSAHSFWSGRRWWNIRTINSYIEKLSAKVLPVEGEEDLTMKQLLDETIMLELRTGFLDISNIKKQFNVDINPPVQLFLKHLSDNGLARIENDFLHMTNKGFLVCDEISEKILGFIS